MMEVPPEELLNESNESERTSSANRSDVFAAVPLQKNNDEKGYISRRHGRTRASSKDDLDAIMERKPRAGTISTGRGRRATGSDDSAPMLQRQRSKSLVVKSRKTSTKLSKYQDELSAISQEINATFAWIQESKDALSRVSTHNKAISQRNLMLVVEEEEQQLEKRISKTISVRNMHTSLADVPEEQESKKTSRSTSSRRPKGSHSSRRHTKSRTTSSRNGRNGKSSSRSSSNPDGSSSRRHGSDRDRRTTTSNRQSSRRQPTSSSKKSPVRRDPSGEAPPRSSKRSTTSKEPTGHHPRSSRRPNATGSRSNRSPTRPRSARSSVRPLPTKGRVKSASPNKSKMSSSDRTASTRTSPTSPASRSNSRRDKMARMTSMSKLYLAQEPDLFLDCAQELDDIKALAKKMALLEEQLEESKKAEQTQIKEIQSNHNITQLLQLEQMAYKEQNKHAKQLFFELHQETMALEAAAQETFQLYDKIEDIHRNEVSKHSALTKKLPDLAQMVFAHERKLKKRHGQIEKERIMTRLCDKYMNKMVAFVQDKSTQPELVTKVMAIQQAGERRKIPTAPIAVSVSPTSNATQKNNQEDSSSSEESGSEDERSEYESSGSEYETDSGDEGEEGSEKEVSEAAAIDKEEEGEEITGGSEKLSSVGSREKDEPSGDRKEEPSEIKAAPSAPTTATKAEPCKEVAPPPAWYEDDSSDEDESSDDGETYAESTAVVIPAPAPAPAPMPFPVASTTSMEDSDSDSEGGFGASKGGSPLVKDLVEDKGSPNVEQAREEETESPTNTMTTTNAEDGTESNEKEDTKWALKTATDFIFKGMDFDEAAR